jgi:hypothetical protein
MHEVCVVVVKQSTIDHSVLLSKFLASKVIGLLQNTAVT